MPNKFPVSPRRPRPTLHGHDAFFLSRDTQFGQCLLCGTQIKMTVCHTEKIQITTQQYDAVPFELALSDWWFDSWCRKLAISLFYKWLHLGSIKSLNIKVYFHTSYKMPFRPQRHKHQTFLSLNSGGLTDAIYLKIRRFAVCFKWKKNVPFVFPSEDCLGFALISIVFYIRRWNRDVQAARHTTARGYQLCRGETSPPFLREGVPAPNLFCLQRRYVSPGHNFHRGHGGRDLCMNGHLHFHFSHKGTI